MIENILDAKQKRIHELDREIAKAGLECGWDDGSGSFEVLDRLVYGEASELEQKRDSNTSLMLQAKILRLMHERSVLIRELERANYKAKPDL